MAKKDAELAKTKDELTKASQGSGDMSAKLKALEEQSEHLSASVKEHEAREAELVTRLKAQEAAANKKSPSSSSKDQSALKNQQAEMSKKLAAVEAREKAVAQREKELADRGDGKGSADGASAANDTELVNENKRLAAELATAKKEIAANQSHAMVRFSSTASGSKVVPPPVFARPPLKPPATIRPAQNIPNKFDSRLLQRFEAGKTALKST